MRLYLLLLGSDFVIQSILGNHQKESSNAGYVSVMWSCSAGPLCSVSYKDIIKLKLNDYNQYLHIISVSGKYWDQLFLESFYSWS